MTSDTRLVWLTEDEVKARWADSTLRERWLAAPADATEAAAGGIANSQGRTASCRTDADRKAAKAVLRALAMPGTEEAT